MRIKRFCIESPKNLQLFKVSAAANSLPIVPTSFGDDGIEYYGEK